MDEQLPTVIVSEQVADLIGKLESRIRHEFYRGHPTFFRDRDAIRRAIARYGYECERRGWNPEPQFIHDEITRILDSAFVHRADIKFLPVYLDHAIAMTVALRAEEIKASKQQIGNIVRGVFSAVEKVEIIREPTTAEVLSDLFKYLYKPKTPKLPCQQQKTFRLT